MNKLILLFAGAGALVWGQQPKEPGILATPNSVNIELAVYVISGMTQPAADAKDEVPQDLASTIQQLHNAFMYKSYKLIDMFTLRSRNLGAAEVGGELNYFNGGQYDFRYRAARYSANTHVVHIDGLRLEITRRPVGPQVKNADPLTVALVSTDLDVGEGQKTVVGKSSVNNGAWFLVVVPKVIQER